MSKAADDFEVTIQPDVSRVSTALSRPLTLPSWNARPLNLPALQLHAEAIRAKPESEWTPEEQQFMSDGAKWAVEAMKTLITAFTPVIETIVSAFIAIRRAFAQVAEERVVSGAIIDSPHWPDAHRPHWPDAHRHIEGLPGVSALCWADKWNEEFGEYVVCNAEGVNELGTCGEHTL